VSALADAPRPERPAWGREGPSRLVDMAIRRNGLRVVLKPEDAGSDAVHEISFARAEIESYERAWFETGELIDVFDVDLLEVREPKGSDLKDEAHVVVL
jgi:hypothetical protein